MPKKTLGTVPTVLQRLIVSFVAEDQFLGLMLVSHDFEQIVQEKVKGQKKLHESKFSALEVELHKLDTNFSSPATRSRSTYHALLQTYENQFSKKMKDISKNRNREQVQAIAPFYSEVNSRDAGFCLLQAIEKRNANLAMVFIQNGADINVIRSEKTTPLHDAIYEQQFGVFQRLLEKKANPNPATEFTPLMAAAEKGLIEYVKLLLAHKADAAAKNAQGETAAVIARQKGHVDCAREIEEHLQQEAGKRLVRSNSKPLVVTTVFAKKNPLSLDDDSMSTHSPLFGS